MYSYEDRIRAVKLYIKLGKRTGATIRQLGYPTKNALKSWHREYEQSRDLPAGYVLSRPKYSDEQKEVAVQHYLNHDRCLAGTLKALGYELSVGRAFVLGVLSPDLLGGYQANISLIGGSRQERSYVGLHVQSIHFRVVDGIYMRGGVGYAATSTGRLGLPDDLRGTTPGSPVSSIRPPLPVMTGDERRNSPFLSLELAHAVQPGVEAFVHAKYFSGFATRDGHEERTFAGVGLRTAF